MANETDPQQHCQAEPDRSKRYAVDWRARFRCPDWPTVTRVVAENASRGGFFLKTTRAPRLGTRLELTISLPDGAELTVVGIVRHIVTPERAAAEGRSPGFGVRVEQAHHTDMMLLEQMALANPPIPADRDDRGRPRDVSVARVATAPMLIVRHARGSGPDGRTAGIDLGSTFASAAVAAHGSMWLAADEAGRARHPAVVHFPGTGDNAVPIAGWQARPRLVDSPRRTVSGARRLLGKVGSDPHIAAWLNAQGYRTAAGPNNEVMIDIDGVPHEPAQVCAAVIGHLRGLIERQLERELTEAVLACPVGFGLAEKHGLRRAAELAGMRVRSLIPEPVAAALAMGAGRSGTELVGVFDWGGARCDFSLVEIGPGIARIVGFEGDDTLAGDDLDQALAGAVADAMWQESGVELRRRVSDWQGLILACEDARRSLSTVESAEVVVNGVENGDASGKLSHRVDRALVERITEEPLERSLTCVRRALADAGLQADALDRLVVVGGMASVPYVRASLGMRFARTVDQIVRPDEVIARGAAIFAAMLEVRSGAPRPA